MTKKLRVGQYDKKVLLHVGCGRHRLLGDRHGFNESEWVEVRLDISPDMNPDILGSITDMSMIEIGAVDYIYSSQNLEHLYAHEVPMALREFRRVLKMTPESKAWVGVPDLQSLGQMISEGRLEDDVCMSPSGPIRPLDILFGHEGFIGMGMTYMAHRTGFTAKTLAQSLIEAGFHHAEIVRGGWDLSATAWVMPS